ncbi:MAG TPA: hypothetical protein VGS58_20090 [Candidatus Sulfopaludibacter sp.]|nr:hypothetical protein [Candidatus Sulfopaludibacter sp.]
MLNDVNLIDGTGAPARAHVRIVIPGERIEAVEDAGKPLPAGAVIWQLRAMRRS